MKPSPVGALTLLLPSCWSLGVPAGGWLFYGLYAACQEWWFLVICLSAWAFVLVASSFYLTGREFLFPVALVTSFIGEWA
jgi:hypothetical protein